MFTGLTNDVAERSIFLTSMGRPFVRHRKNIGSLFVIQHLDYVGKPLSDGNYNGL